jgi:hypothetical protein
MASRKPYNLLQDFLMLFNAILVNCITAEQRREGD